ncbi:MAG: PfkB family carbohydrate kinase [Caldilineaceae bacterium]
MTTVASLGIHIVDILGRPVTAIPPGQNVDILEEIRITVAGTAAGTSIDMAKLRLDVMAMETRWARMSWATSWSTPCRATASTRRLRRKDGVQTSATMLPIRPNGDRPALHVPGANGELTWEDLDLDAIARADFLHMGGTSLMPKFDGEPTVRVLRYAKEHGVTTTFDLVAIDRPDLLDLIEPCLPYIDYFMPGLDEARMMCKLDARQDVINFFLDRGTGHTVFKMGVQGSSIASQTVRFACLRWRCPWSIPPAVAMRTARASSRGLGMGWSVEEAGRLGTAAAGLVITGLETGPRAL